MKGGGMPMGARTGLLAAMFASVGLIPSIKIPTSHYEPGKHRGGRRFRGAPTKMGRTRQWRQRLVPKHTGKLNFRRSDPRQ